MQVGKKKYNILPAYSYGLRATPRTCRLNGFLKHNVNKRTLYQVWFSHDNIIAPPRTHCVVILPFHDWSRCSSRRHQHQTDIQYRPRPQHGAEAAACCSSRRSSSSVSSSSSKTYTKQASLFHRNRHQHRPPSGRSCSSNSSSTKTSSPQLDEPLKGSFLTSP